MQIRLYKEDALAVDLQEIALGLNKLAQNVTFELGRSKLSLRGNVIASPATYRVLDSVLLEESKLDDRVICFTSKQYDNNYFWDAPSKNLVIVSLYAWERLTRLPRNNGAVYFVCALLARDLAIGVSHRERNTGCINDFWADKTGIDAAMRAAYVCDVCLRDFSPRASERSTAILKDIQAILDKVSGACREGRDVTKLWREVAAPSAEFDVFLCHSSEDKLAVREVNTQLRRERIHTWFDEEQLRPGLPWQDLLEEQIQSVKTAAIIVGASGIGPWQNVELRAFLQEFVRRRCPVIPVILRDCENVPRLPLFLSQLTWVDFRKQSPDPFRRLLWGITGVR